jgi:propionyl-CoA carboxylase alpha chain
MQALDEYVIRGVTHNIPFLRDVYEHKKFISGDITTAFIEEEYPGMSVCCVSECVSE